jgi:arylsulfatase A
MRFLSRLVCLALIILSSTVAQAANARPNIVYILADDLGYGELSIHGADHFQTPNIDSLAKGGVRFTRFFTAPLCGPSRALILTGRYAFRTGAVSQDACRNLVRTGEQAEEMLPTVLGKAGYASAMIGKWGQLAPSGSPAEWGFGHDFHFKASGVYWNSKTVKKMNADGSVRGDPDSYTKDGKVLPLRDGEYMPDLLHEDAVSWIEAHKDAPFFLYYSMSHIHGEILPTPDSAPVPPGTSESAREAQHYKDNVHYMDKLVGKLLAELDRMKLRENTLVVFMGDNGTGKSHAPVATIGGRRIEGEKGSMKEGGGLVPLIASWPGVTPAGKVIAHVADASDLLATFAEVAGAPLPKDRVIDGRSLVPQFKGETQSPRTWAYCQLSNHYYVRENLWKLDQAGNLFDMSDAPYFESPVAPDSADPAAVEARKRLAAALAELNPGAGIKDAVDGSGRSSNKKEKKAKKEKQQSKDE